MKSLRIYNLTEELELDDNVASLYRKSLLYLVSNAFEGADPSKGEPLLGMAKFKGEVNLDGNAEIIYSGEPRRSNSKSHGGFDNDVDTMNDILHHVLGAEPERLFTRKDLDF